MDLESAKPWASRQALEEQIVKRAQEDPAFREELLRDPQAALAQLAGGALPPGVDIVVHEETPRTIHLVLPPNPHRAESWELTDADLDKVAGGSWCYDAYWGWYYCG